jgi:enamine deaminase RidA (YjgF/YER057c/UK114 family)
MTPTSPNTPNRTTATVLNPHAMLMRPNQESSTEPRSKEPRRPRDHIRNCPGATHPAAEPAYDLWAQRGREEASWRRSNVTIHSAGPSEQRSPSPPATSSGQPCPASPTSKKGEPVFADTFDEQLCTAGRHAATELANFGCTTADIIDASVFIHPDIDIDPGLLLDQLHQHVFGETAPALLIMRAASIYPASLIAIKITAVRTKP